MMTSIRATVATVVLCMNTALAVAAAAPTIPVDSAGRPLKNGSGQPLEYPTAPVASPWLAPAPSANKTTFSSPRQKQRVVRMQSTGTSPSYVDTWRTSSWGTGIGGTGIWPVDADSDGDDEFVLGGGSYFGGNAFWSIVAYNATAQRYEIEWQSPPYYSGGYSPAITALRVVQIANTKRVWIGRSDGRVDVVNLLTRELIQSLAPSANQINDFAIGDADNDGNVDVVAVTSTQSFLYAPTTLSLRRTLAYGGIHAVIGNVDADGNLETVYNTGQVVEATSSTASLQWSSPTPFGARIDLADIDGDGFAELVGAESWYVIRAFDLDLQSIKWTFNADLDIGAFRLIDVTGTSVPEIVYGDGQWGQIHVVDAATRTELWNISNPEHGTTDIAVFDSDGDGAREILWGAGWSSSGPDYLYVHDLSTQAAEWQSSDYSGPFEAVDIGDVDADGRAEIVVSSFDSQSGYSDGQLMVFDAQTHELEWTSEPAVFNGSAITGVHGLKLVNVDSDAQLEIIVTTDRLYDGALYVIDGLTHLRQNEALYDSGSPLSVLDAADLTGDGRPEIVTGNQVAHTGSPGVFAYVLDPVTDAVVWKSAALAGGFAAVSDIHVADAGATGVDLLAVTGPVHAIRWSDKRHLVSVTSNYVSVTVGDVAAAAGNEILAGTNAGTIDVLDGETLNVITSYNVCSSRIAAMTMHASNQVLLTCDDMLIVYSTAAGAVVDTTDTGIPELGRNSSLVRAIVGNRALVLTGGHQAVLFRDSSTNQLPAVSTASATLHWRSSVDVHLSASDADGDALRFELVSLPAHGTAQWLDATQGVLRYTSTEPRTGSDSLQVRVSDGSQYSASQTVSLTLTNGAPTPQTTALSFHWRGSQNARLQATDPEGDPLTFAVTNGPGKGTFVVSNAATGEATFVPTGAFAGSDVMTYTVSDGPASLPVTVQITLTNTAPVATNTQIDINAGATTHSRVSATDADGDPLAYSILQQPSRGSLSLEAATGLFQYVPAAGVTGATDTVTFAISDGISQTQATVQFRYPGSSSSGGGGGGAFGIAWLALLGLYLVHRQRLRAA